MMFCFETHAKAFLWYFHLLLARMYLQLHNFYGENINGDYLTNKNFFPINCRPLLKTKVGKQQLLPSFSYRMIVPLDQPFRVILCLLLPYIALNISIHMTHSFVKLFTLLDRPNLYIQLK